jgi:hypothetical protein
LCCLPTTGCQPSRRLYNSIHWVRIVSISRSFPGLLNSD